MFGRHEPNVVTLLTEEPPEVMGAAAGLHRHHTAWQLAGQPDETITCEPAPHYATPGLVEPRDAAAVLTQVDP